MAPVPAAFDRNCRRVNDVIVMSEGNTNVYLIETSGGGILINAGTGF